ncbi:hypothetical protein PV326_003515 [Microctonus aethiopoides]|nr:hypothetical protein PV326_003515 [Microctonus aethiopoides]
MMIYVLPPPDAPKPPSPWTSIFRSMCRGDDDFGGGNSDDDRCEEKYSRRFKLRRSRALQMKYQILTDSGAGAPTDEEDATRGCKR